MLLNLHVKNIALIREADIDLSGGLNIFTGETGAGKSLLLGSVNLALGRRPGPGILRHGEHHALVELTFQIENERTRQLLEQEGVEAEDDLIVISRKISGSKSIFRVNGEGSSASQIKRLAAGLLDIHGQHDHQSLLYSDRQLEILDRYAGEETAPLLEKMSAQHSLAVSLRREYEAFDMDDRQRLREKELLEHELKEIREAAVREGEEEELDARYRKLEHGRVILSTLQTVHQLAGYDSGAADRVGRAVREMESLRELDPELDQIHSLLADADALLSDLNHSVSSYLASFSYSEQELAECGQRLDEIRHIQSKYGSTVEKIEQYASDLEERMSFLDHYEQEKKNLESRIARAEEEEKQTAQKLSSVRREYAARLEQEIIRELSELNFQGVQFRIDFSEKERILSDGMDQVEYQISVNPGEPLLPLAKIASGGELSRIMLAIKTILSANDPVETLVFDEIDAGISGRTAVSVAEKLQRIGASHQVLCITHLAQIAAAGDAHYAIRKIVENEETQTIIQKLDGDQSEKELARLLGGAAITDTVLQNAKELKAMAGRRKE